jgi:hypothetical protein
MAALTESPPLNLPGATMRIIYWLAFVIFAIFAALSVIPGAYILTAIYGLGSFGALICALQARRT